ncbi:MAG: SGNH/GDSL hydrolase family protein [Lachnospiraceae bacterium]|nr:SGNH/GDSL hydrolase family protein [Lachnospiraceae bacterium]
MFFLKKSIYKKICMALAGMMLVLCCAAVPAGSVDAADASILSMYRRAVDFPQGDLSRLAQVIRRAQCGEEITIGFLGGSITEGHGAEDIQDCYVSQVYKWWKDTFPQAEIAVVNAGIGGTSSYLGVHRVETELLVHKPDLVFIEFAANDTFTTFCMNSYENLIRKVLMAESNPALVLLFAANSDGNSSQAVEAALGQYYELPMISYGNAVIPEVQAGSFMWHEIAVDTVHPNNMGHSIFARLIITCLEDVCSRLDQIAVRTERLQRYELPVPVTPQIYQNAHIENAATITPLDMTGYGIYDFNYHFTDNWYSMEDGSFLSFVVEARNIGVLYQRTVEGTFGQYDVYIDDVYVKTLDGNYVEFYGTETEAEALYSSPDGSTAAHVIKIVKNPQSANIDFVLIGLLLS